MSQRSNTLPLSDPRPSNASTAPIYRSSTNTAATTGPSKYATASQSEQKLEGSRTFNIFHPEKYEKYKGAAKDADSTTIGSNSAPSVPGRPEMPTRTNSVQTRYMNMLLSLDTIPRLHNIYASFFTWILLAGFVIFPGTFTNIQSLESKEQIENNAVASTFFKAFKNTPLLIIAAVCCGIGAAGMLWLWWRWSDNCVWLLNKIFMPGCLNSLTGLITTLINVYSQQDGDWSVTAKVTAIVTGACMVILGALFAVYNFWILERVKKTHSRDMEASFRDETLIEKVERKAHEPALEPGSVV